jgi:hypothetical protein
MQQSIEQRGHRGGIAQELAPIIFWLAHASITVPSTVTCSSAI